MRSLSLTGTWTAFFLQAVQVVVGLLEATVTCKSTKIARF